MIHKSFTRANAFLASARKPVSDYSLRYCTPLEYDSVLQSPAPVAPSHPSITHPRASESFAKRHSSPNLNNSRPPTPNNIRQSNRYGNSLVTNKSECNVDTEQYSTSSRTYFADSPRRIELQKKTRMALTTLIAFLRGLRCWRYLFRWRVGLFVLIGFFIITRLLGIDSLVRGSTYDRNEVNLPVFHEILPRLENLHRHLTFEECGILQQYKLDILQNIPTHLKTNFLELLQKCNDNNLPIVNGNTSASNNYKEEKEAGLIIDSNGNKLHEDKLVMAAGIDGNSKYQSLKEKNKKEATSFYDSPAWTLLPFTNGLRAVKRGFETFASLDNLLRQIRFKVEEEKREGLTPFYTKIWQVNPETKEVTWTPFIKKRRALHEIANTNYACPGDPIMLAVTAGNIALADDGEPLLNKLSRVASLMSKQNIPPGLNSNAVRPYKLGLLFMLVKPLAHPDAWVQWLEEAERYSRSLFDARQGPYKDIPLLTADGTPMGDDIYTPLYSLTVHVSSGGTKFYTELLDVWRQWINNNKNSRPKSAEITKQRLPTELREALIAERDCGWGNLNPCAHQILLYGLRDANTNGFIFISETTIPAKPFSFIYEEYQKNTRSRFFFSDLNLPETPKHHQWIVLNRKHAYALVEHPEKWVCETWLRHRYSTWQAIPDYAAPDEYLPFYALRDLFGEEELLSEINDGNIYALAIDQEMQDYHKDASGGLPEVPGSRKFRHTWLCWYYQMCGMQIPSESCDLLGDSIKSLRSPVTYTKLYGDQFQKIVIQNRNVWFARKFSHDCIVEPIAPKGHLQQAFPSQKRPLFLSSFSLSLHQLPTNNQKSPTLQKQGKSSLEDNNDSINTSLLYADVLNEKAVVEANQLPTPVTSVKSTLSEWLNLVLDPVHFATLPLHDYPDNITAILGNPLKREDN